MSNLSYISNPSISIRHRASQVRSWNPVSYRTEKRFSRKAKNLFKLSVLFLIIAAIAVLMMSIWNPAQAEESGAFVKQYKSIVIHPGDSLWSIASDYMDGHYSSRQEYISELMFINNLDSDLIYANEYLLVPYYD